MGYLTVDFFLCYFLIADTSAGMMQNYFHHAVGIGGTVVSLIVGRMILTLSNATCITEMSTPFVSLRALLYMHHKTDTTLYLINGLMMTVIFFIFRVCFQTYLVFFRLAPSVISRGAEMMIETDDFTKFAMYISLCMYLSLVGLNFFWFNKMLMGLLKFFNKPTKSKQNINNQNKTD
jgi:hypothetical protein